MGVAVSSAVKHTGQSEPDLVLESAPFLSFLEIVEAALGVARPSDHRMRLSITLERPENGRGQF